MNLDKAIKDNEEHSKHHKLNPYPDYFNALQLGIEALKRLETLRANRHLSPQFPLPGEDLP